ncbi:acetone carboxylase subunit gamma [Nevskia soli]|uniref:acetone carboxylase subunit gamma n=1 Tax=Nevskia soli TaxID=418856 RepID=UPI00055CD51F|nr:acetone carboxylase subunit gamma [Nevskia soli]
MKVPMTEYLEIDLDRELWLCRVCGHEIGPARGLYKEGLLVHARDPREIHKPVLDPEMYEFTFAPDPSWVQILEYYCPSCATMVEVEYLPPGHPPVHDMDFDIDALKAQWKTRKPLTAGELAGPDMAHFAQHTHSRKEKAQHRHGGH